MNGFTFIVLLETPGLVTKALGFGGAVVPICEARHFVSHARATEAAKSQAPSAYRVHEVWQFT